MTDKKTPKPLSAISPRAAQLSIAAVITYQLLLIALIFIRPDLDPSWHTISEWAIGPHGWIMSLCISYLSNELRFLICSDQITSTRYMG
jgi:hypothetical protein